MKLDTSMGVQEEVLIFIAAFVAGVLWYRLLFFIIPIYFKRPLTRSVLKVHWHHLHWGALLVLLGMVLLLTMEGLRLLSIAIIGVGLGFIFDLFIPSLLLVTNREEELKVYKRSLLPTVVLTLSVAVLVFGLAWFI